MAPLPQSTDRRLVLIALALVLISATAVGTHAAAGVRSAAAYPPDFDEAVHVLPILQISNDLRRLDLAAFWAHSYTQDRIALYPFFHSWLAAPFFLLWPPSLTVARLANLAFLCLAIVACFLLGCELSPSSRWRWLSGLIGAGMIVASLPLWVYASVVYLEAAGLLVSVGALFCAVRAAPEKQARAWPLAASLLTTAAFFTKWSFGLAVAGGIACSEALGWAITRRASGRRWLRLAAPVLLLCLLWFANPEKIDSFQVYGHSQHPNMEPWSTQSLLFYPRSLTHQYASDPLLCGLMLLGVAVGLCRLRQHRYRVVLSYLLVGLCMITLVPQKEHRFAYTIAPVALTLGGTGAGWIAERLQRALRSPVARIGAAILAVLLLGSETRAVTNRVQRLHAAQEIAYLSSTDTRLAYQFIADHTLAHGLRPHLLNPWHLFSSYALAWEYYAEHGGDPAGHEYQLATADLAPEPTPENLDLLVQSLSAQGVNGLVSIEGSPAGSTTSWQIIEPLWARGDIEWLASSEDYALREWRSRYEERVLAGDFRDAEELEAARQDGLVEFQIRLHLFRILPTQE